MTDTGFNLFTNVLPDVYICPLSKTSAPICLMGTVKCTPGSVANSQRMRTKINESGTIAKIRI